MSDHSLKTMMEKPERLFEAVKDIIENDVEREKMEKVCELMKEIIL